MKHETRNQRRRRRIRFWIMLAACLIVTVAAASTMVQAVAKSPQPTAEEYLREIGADNAQRAAMMELDNEWEHETEATADEARLAWNTRAPILSSEEMEMLEGMEHGD